MALAWPECQYCLRGVLISITYDARKIRQGPENSRLQEKPLLVSIEAIARFHCGHLPAFSSRRPAEREYLRWLGLTERRSRTQQVRAQLATLLSPEYSAVQILRSCTASELHSKGLPQYMSQEGSTAHRL